MQAIQEIDAHDLARQLQVQPGDLRVIDVRTPAEAAQGVIPGAECVPLHLVPLHADKWHADDATLVFYCRSGARSAQACAFLASRGRQRVVNLRGGIMGWAGNGLPLAAPSMAGVATG